MDVADGLLSAVFSQTGFGTLICLLLVVYLFRRQDKQDAAQEAQSKANMEVIIANTKAQTESAAAMQNVANGMRELAAKIDTLAR